MVGTLRSPPFRNKGAGTPLNNTRGTRGKDTCPAMTPEPSIETVLYRLDSMDKRLERMETSVERLAFVSLDLYRSEQAAQNERIEATARLAMWALGLVCTTTIGLLVTGLVRLATA